jgi:hypothetical protein
VNDFTSGSAFYSEPNPANIGSPVPDNQQFQQDSQTFDQQTQIPQSAATPVYTRYNDAGEDTFAPSQTPMDPTFQPDVQPAPQTGFQFQPWMLLAAGAALVLMMRNDR